MSMQHNDAWRGRIQELMRALNVNARELARRTDLPVTSVYGLLRDREPAFTTMGLIAGALGTTLDYLYCGEARTDQARPDDAIEVAFTTNGERVVALQNAIRISNSLMCESPFCVSVAEEFGSFAARDVLVFERVASGSEPPPAGTLVYAMSADQSDGLLGRLHVAPRLHVDPRSAESVLTVVPMRPGFHSGRVIASHEIKLAFAGSVAGTSLRYAPPGPASTAKRNRSPLLPRA